MNARGIDITSSGIDLASCAWSAARWGAVLAVLALGSAGAALCDDPLASPRPGTADATGAPRASASRGHRARIRTLGGSFDLESPKGLRKLIAAIDREIDTKKKKKKDGTERDALLMMRSLAHHALDGEEHGDGREDAVMRIEEIGAALDLDGKYPVPRCVDLIQLPFLLQDTMANPVGVGREPAWNLPSRAEREHQAGSPANPPADGDSSHVDPLPSTFWSRPRDIASLDLYEPFGPIPRLDDQICVYDEPKTSYGTSPGFDVKCGERPVKVKFGETENLKRNSEVAVTRIFGALGFHVEPNDYAPEVRVRYDRRIFLEFNSRKPLSIRITALGVVPVHTIAIQKEHDPFQFVRHAVTRGGEKLTSEALAAKLIRPEILEREGRKVRKDPPGTLPDHYRDDAAAFESGLDYLVMEEANVQLREEGAENIGPWDWNRLGHPGRRELRGAGLVAAWTNYFDARWDNNRLKLVDRDGGKDLLHVISDLGNSLGRAKRLGSNAAGLVNEFPWTFTEGPVLSRKGRVKRPFRIVDYQPQIDNLAFLEMTIDDARWMARMIALLTENQIQQLLIATGYTSAEVRLYTEKLISRRDAMIRDLGLAEEIAPLRPHGVDQTFDYDPRKDGPIVARARDGSSLRPLESRDLVVRRGRVEPR